MQISLLNRDCEIILKELEELRRNTEKGTVCHQYTGWCRGGKGIDGIAEAVFTTAV